MLMLNVRKMTKIPDIHLNFSLVAGLVGNVLPNQKAEARSSWLKKAAVTF